jgi:DivIVA domain-containing protein
MPLTAEDVKNKQFTPTRFKGGYDEKEVDDFLDEVEAELNRLYRENSDLRARLQVAEQAARQAAAGPVPTGPQAGQPPQAPGVPGGPQPFTAPPAPDVTAVVPPVRPTGPAEGTQEAALRMLTMAQKTADDTVAEARRDAEKMLAEARIKAEQLERETQERHRSVVGSLDSEREKLERKVEELRSFEREYRARLKSYLEGQLRDLEGRGDGAAPRPAPTPGAAGPTPPSAPGLAPPPPAGPGQGTPGGPPAGGPPPVPGVQAPARPASPFAPVAAPQPPAADNSGGPSGPPRQAPAGGFEVDEGPEVPPSNG